MLDRDFIQKLRQFKEGHGYTLYDLSRKIDVQIPTLERWFRTGRINKVYAQVVREKLGLLK